MKVMFTLFTLATMLTFSSCHRYYTSRNFETVASRHKTVAILPPQVIFTGNLPREMTKAQMQKLEERESILFQEALFNNILLRGNKRKQELSVDLQAASNTIAALKKNNISIRESWLLSDEKLSQILGVDAVVRTSIQKQRIMSDLASAGIDIGRKVLSGVLLQTGVVPGLSNNTNDIVATCSIVSNGEVLWNDAYNRASDWNSPANKIIENITDNFAKHFPYKRRV